MEKLKERLADMLKEFKQSPHELTDDSLQTNYAHDTAKSAKSDYSPDNSTTYVHAGAGGAGQFYITGGGGAGGGGMWAGTTSSTATNPIWTTVTTGTGGTVSIPNPVHTVNNTAWIGGIGPTGGLGSYQAPKSTSISVGSDFAISGPTAGNDQPVTLKYKDKTLDVGEMFTMFAAFKGLLKVVAKDQDFCQRHPEVAELAQAFLIEELSK